MSRNLYEMLQNYRKYNKRLEIIAALATFLLVAGAILINYKLSICFKLLVVGNILSLHVHYKTGPTSFVVRDVIFLLISIWGALLWD
jgi:uncharacterized membrane protein